jgi:hypothetical protein
VIIGHYAVSFWASRSVRELPLWQTMIAVVWLDILHAALVIVGVEKAAIEPGVTAVVPVALLDYPWSHSLLASVLWSAATWALYAGWIARRSPGRFRVATMAAVAVFSHEVLDFVTHRPDLPIVSGEPKFGLGLWNHTVATYALENGLLFGTWWFYTRDGSVRPRERHALLALCVVGSAMFFAFPVAPFPGDIRVVEACALVSYALVPLVAFWSRRRELAAAPALS